MPDTPDAPTSGIATAATATARADDLAARLRRVLPADAVAEHRPACARYAVAGRVPLVVVTPCDAEGVGAALAVAAETHAAVVPWGNGTRQALGCPPERYDLALSLRRLDAVLDHDPAALSVTVQAGITHAALAQRLATAGQMLPLDVARPRMATVGGTLACDTPGPRQSSYGGAHALTLGLRALAFARGETSVDGAGGGAALPADAGQLQIGALGTLGVIVEARLKVMPLPETETTLLGIFGSVAAALDAVPALAALVPRPSALTVARAGALAPLASLASTTHGGRALLAVRLSGAVAAVARSGQMGRSILRRAGARTILSVESHLQEAFWGPVLDFTQTATRRPAEALLRIAAPPVETADIMRHAAEVAAAHNLSAAELADALSGTIWLRLRPRHRGQRTSADAAADDQHTLARELPAVCASLRQRWPRTVILDCPPALAPAPYVWGAPPQPAAGEALRAARRRLDPAGLLNPGRYPVDGDGA